MALNPESIVSNIQQNKIHWLFYSGTQESRLCVHICR